VLNLNQEQKDLLVLVGKPDDGSKTQVFVDGDLLLRLVNNDSMDDMSLIGFRVASLRKVRFI
jgi:hypothetical protein